MKNILSLLSFLMLAVVAMAADLTTGVTFKGTWADTPGLRGTTDGEMTVTKVEGGLKFEVKGCTFGTLAFPDYTVVYYCDLNADGSFFWGGNSNATLKGEADVTGLNWAEIKGSVTNEAVDLFVKYFTVNGEEWRNVTFKGEAVASPDPEPEVTVVSTKDFTDKLVFSYIDGEGQKTTDPAENVAAKFIEMSDGTFNIEFPESGLKFEGLLQKRDPKTERVYFDGTCTSKEKEYDVTAYLYTKDDAECLYMIAKNNGPEQYTYEYGTDQYAEPGEQPEFTTYTAPAMYTYASEDEETPGTKRFVEAQEIQLADNGDGTYTVIIKNLGDSAGDPAGDVQFTATATKAEDGTVTLAADTQADLGGYYEGFPGAVKFNGTLVGEDLTAKYNIDIPSGAAHGEFGKGVTNGINTLNNANNTITNIYTVGGAKVNSLYKGINIVRLANGKTVKVIK